MGDIKKNGSLNAVEQIALAYTVKTSLSDSPEQFFDDFTKNIELFMEIEKKKNPRRWLI